MEKEIQDAIKLIREEKHERPSSERIYKQLKERNPSLDSEAFRNTLKCMESSATICNRGKKNVQSNFICDQNENISFHDIHDEVEEGTQCDLISEKLERLNLVNLLQDEVIYFKKSLDDKQNTIDKLLMIIGNFQDQNNNNNNNNIGNFQKQNQNICGMMKSLIRDDHKYPSQNTYFNLQHNTNLNSKQQKSQDVTAEDTQWQLIQKRKKDHNKKNVTSLRKNSFVSKNFFNVLNDVDDTTLNVPNAIEESSSKSETTISSSKKLSVTILGDSILKDVKSYKMKKAINHQANIYVKSFSGATVDDMASYVLPTKKHNPDIVVLHCG